jgi:hypothetical protein
MSAIKEKERSAPDVVIMNSCLWDVTRCVTNVKNVPCYFILSFCWRCVTHSLPNPLHDESSFFLTIIANYVLCGVTFVCTFCLIAIYLFHTCQMELNVLSVWSIYRENRTIFFHIDFLSKTDCVFIFGSE